MTRKEVERLLANPARANVDVQLLARFAIEAMTELRKMPEHYSNSTNSMDGCRACALLAEWEK